MDPEVKIGHINLARSINSAGEHFVALVEALDRQSVEQYVIVQNEALAKRLQVYENVVVAPTTAAVVVAYCLMPQVDVVHTHDERSGQAGLLLTLTRSMPYVLTLRQKPDSATSPVMRSIYNRAAAIICTTNAGARAISGFQSPMPVDVINDFSQENLNDFELTGNRIAAEHLRIYHRVAGTSNIPVLLL